LRADKIIVMKKIIILDNIRSAHNVGSIFRTADGAGVLKIYLLGYTPVPIDRFGRVQKEIAKTSLGANELLEWEQVSDKDAPALLARLKAEDFKIISVEQAVDSQSLDEFNTPEKVAYILGNEIDGVGKNLLDLSDIILEIPMKGKKESLNVAVTTGIVLFHKTF